MSHAAASTEIPYTVKPRPDTGLFNAKLGIWLFLASEVMLFGALFSSYIMLRVGADEWPHGLLSVPLGTINTFILATSTITTVMAWFSLKLGDFARFKRFQGGTVLLALAFITIKSFEYRAKFTHYAVVLKDGTELTGHLEGNPWNWTLADLDNPAHPIKQIVLHPDAAHGEHATHETHGNTAQQPGTGGPTHGHAKPLTIPRDQIEKLESFGPWHNTFLACYFLMTGVHVLHVIGGALVMAWFWGPGSRLWHRDPEHFTNRVETAGLFWHFVDLVWIFLFPTLYLI